MSSRIKKLIKPALGILAGLMILNLFCTFYYNPTGYIPSGTGATDLVREKGAFTSRATEGIAFMHIDEYGYVNPSVPGDDGIFVLMMGSSHTEALNVMPEDNASAQLERMLHDAGYSGCVYNIGMSSHTMVRNVSNYPAALDAFNPTGYVVLETADVIMYTHSLEDARTGQLERLPATGADAPGFITGIPLFKTLYRQISNLTGEGHTELYADHIPEDAMERYEQELVTVFTMMRDEAAAHGAEVIVYYHPHLDINFDGSVSPATQHQCIEAFTRAADTAGITFVDMTPIFMDEYAAAFILPHGFSNTPAGTGHLNPEGHRMIAEELFRVISEKEAGK